MKKSDIAVLGCFLVLGAILMIAGLKTDRDYYSTLLFASGFAMAANALVNLVRKYHNTRPENRAEYERKIKEQSINLKDERKVYLRYKAAYRTMQLTVMVCFFGSGILAWLRGNIVVISVLFAIAVSQYVVAGLIYKYLCSKM